MINKLICTFLSVLILSHKTFAAIYSEPNHTLPIAEVTIVLTGGLNQDSISKSGLNNMTLSMLLKGTKTLSKNELRNALKKIGAKIHTFSHANHSGITISYLSENESKALDLFCDIILNPSFNEVEFSLYKQSYISGYLHMLSNNQELADRSFRKFHFQNPVKSNIPTELGLNSITLNEIKENYRRIFSLNNFVIFTNGNVDNNKVSELQNKLNQKLPPSYLSIEFPKEDIPASGHRLLLVDKPDANQSSILIGLKGARPDDSLFFNYMIASYVLGAHNYSSILMKELAAKRGLTYGAYFTNFYSNVAEYAVINLEPKTTDTIQALTLTLKILDDFKKNGVTKEQYQFAQRALINHSPFLSDTYLKRSDNNIVEYEKNLPFGYFNSIEKKYAAADFSDLKKSLNKYLDTENISIVVLGNMKTLEKQLRKIPNLSEIKKISYKDFN